MKCLKCRKETTRYDGYCEECHKAMEEFEREFDEDGDYLYNYNQREEEDAWQETLVQIQKSPCIKCGCTTDHTVYNDHDGQYYTYDRICDNCGHVKLSLLD